MTAETDKSTTPLVTYGNIVDVVTDKIRERVLEGLVQPGEWLRQADLARDFGVSAMPVREALRTLQAEGLVVFHPRRGAMVTKFSISQLIEIDMIMEELEVLACTWLAEDFGRLPMDEMHAAFANLEEAERHHDVNARLRAVRDFKFYLYRAVQKSFLLEMLSNLFDLGIHWRRVFSSVPGLSSARVEAYRNILHACDTQDASALITATRSLYALARETVIAELRRQESTPSGEAAVDAHVKGKGHPRVPDGNLGASESRREAPDMRGR